MSYMSAAEEKVQEAVLKVEKLERELKVAKAELMLSEVQLEEYESS
jgi:hypothetical protein